MGVSNSNSSLSDRFSACKHSIAAAALLWLLGSMCTHEHEGIAIHHKAHSETLHIKNSLAHARLHHMHANSNVAHAISAA